MPFVFLLCVRTSGYVPCESKKKFTPRKLLIILKFIYEQ